MFIKTLLSLTWISRIECRCFCCGPRHHAGHSTALPRLIQPSSPILFLIPHPSSGCPSHHLAVFSSFAISSMPLLHSDAPSVKMAHLYKLRDASLSQPPPTVPHSHTTGHSPAHDAFPTTLSHAPVHPPPLSTLYLAHTATRPTPCACIRALCHLATPYSYVLLSAMTVHVCFPYAHCSVSRNGGGQQQTMYLLVLLNNHKLLIWMLCHPMRGS